MWLRCEVASEIRLWRLADWIILTRANRQKRTAGPFMWCQETAARATAAGDVCAVNARGRACTVCFNCLLWWNESCQNIQPNQPTNQMPDPMIDILPNQRSTALVYSAPTISLVSTTTAHIRRIILWLCFSMSFAFLETTPQTSITYHFHLRQV